MIDSTSSSSNSSNNDNSSSSNNNSSSSAPDGSEFRSTKSVEDTGGSGQGSGSKIDGKSFSDFDTNDTNLISETEFSEGYSDYSQEQIDSHFDAVDTNGDNLITQDEFNEAAKSGLTIGSMAQTMEPEAPAGGGGAAGGGAGGGGAVGDGGGGGTGAVGGGGGTSSTSSLPAWLQELVDAGLISEEDAAAMMEDGKVTEEEASALPENVQDLMGEIGSFDEGGVFQPTSGETSSSVDSGVAADVADVTDTVDTMAA